MRNLKRALSLALSSVMLLGMMVVGTSAASYPDVDAQDNLEAIEVLDILGVMSGDENGKFNPDAKITRNEMAVVMTHLLKLNAGGTSPFTDVPAWAQPYVAACYANGVTAGTSATTYGGSNNVTAVEAALMVMKALGYFGYQGEFADNWTLAVVKQATKINLFNGIDAAATDAITRSEAAQMCLNALEATVTVVTEEGGLAVDGNGISVNVKPRYDYKDAENKDFNYTGNGANSVGNGTMQLCEKLYGQKLYKDVSGTKTDKFGRPANEWTYAGKAVTTPKAADVTYTAEVSAKTLYNDLGLSAEKVASVYVDSQTSKSNFNVTKTDADADKKIGGNGTVVEGYKILKSDGTLDALKLVVINTYANEITKVTPAKDGDPATVNVKNVTKAYETTGYEKGDIVVYTMADDEIQSMALATKVEAAEVTKVTGDTSFVAGGTTYKYGEKIAATLKTGDVGSTQDLYLDANGYVVYIDEYEGSSDYAYVLKTGAESGRFDKAYYAQLLTADGSVVEAKVTKANDKTSDNGDEAMSGAVEALAGDIVKYSKNSKDEYTVSTMTADYSNTKGSVDINKGESKMTFNGTAVYANSKTLFLVQNGTGDKATYTAYTGYANVPNMTSSSAEYVVYCESSQATVVFVKGVAAAGDNQLVYVLGTKAGTEVNDSDAGKYYEYKAVIDGEITTINLDTVISADTLFSNLVLDDYNVVDVSASTKYSTSEKQDSYVIAKATLNGDYENDVLAIDKQGSYDTSFAVSSDIEVYEVTTGDKIEAGSTGSLVDNATVTLVIENAEVVAAFVIVK